jgi:hypothetical protein
MVEAVAETLFFGTSALVVVTALAFSMVGLLLAVPAIALIPVVSEYEGELRARQELPPGYVPVADRVPRYMVRIFIVFIGVFAIRALR